MTGRIPACYGFKSESASWNMLKNGKMKSLQTSCMLIYRISLSPMVIARKSHPISEQMRQAIRLLGVGWHSKQFEGNCDNWISRIIRLHDGGAISNTAEFSEWILKNLFPTWKKQNNMLEEMFLLFINSKRLFYVKVIRKKITWCAVW